MKLLETTLTLFLATGSLFYVAGCDSSQQQTSPQQSTENKAENDEHEHTEGGHSHGAGPHEGTLADWGGGKFHVEFTVNHDKKEATVYIVGSDEKTATPIKSEEIQLSIKDPAMQVTLKASPQEGDPEGSASRFVGNHDSLGVVQEYEGTMSGVVDGTPYSGNFKEEAHDHE